MKIFSGKGDFSIPETGVSRIEQVTIGGITQSILIQTESIENPVLLIIHGGPSLPFPGVGCRSSDYTMAINTKELVKHYIVVFWDQRGTGKSYHSDIQKESMNLNQFVADTDELTDYLLTHFDKEKIFLAGYSWGTILGLRLASEKPEKFYAYVGLSQIINWAENDRLCRNWALEVARKKGDHKAIQALEEIGEPPYVKSFEQWGVLRKWLMKYKSMVYTDEHIKHPGVMAGVGILLKSPDYTLADIYHTFVSGFKLSYNQQMIEDFAEVDFIKSASKVNLPIYFFHGTKDVHVFGLLLEEYVAKVESSYGKQIYWLEKSSHMFHPDDTKIIERIMINVVHKIAFTI